MKKDLTVYIPTYNNSQDLWRCLYTLTLNTNANVRTIVINNDPSTKEIIDTLVSQEGLDNVEVVHQVENVGWMGGVNSALAIADTTYFCMLNDDVVFIPGMPMFWDILLRHFDDPTVAAVAPCSSFASGVQSLYETGLPYTLDTTFLAGFCLVTKTDLLRDSGGLDENLTGGDDVDLSIRFIDKGMRLVCDRAAYVHHVGQRTGNRVHEGFWNSEDYQEILINELIKKHGVSSWWRSFKLGWNKYEPVLLREPSDA
jgi:GT2 family glycosyltransferase